MLAKEPLDHVILGLVTMVLIVDALVIWALSHALRDARRTSDRLKAAAGLLAAAAVAVGTAACGYRPLQRYLPDSLLERREVVLTVTKACEAFDVECIPGPNGSSTTLITPAVEVQAAEWPGNQFRLTSVHWSERPWAPVPRARPGQRLKVVLYLSPDGQVQTYRKDAWECPRE